MRGARSTSVIAAVVVSLVACDGATGPAIDAGAPPVEGEPVVYVAIGASESAGVGTQDPFSQAWPKVLWRDSLPEAVLYDLARPGSTLAEALAEQSSEARRLHPDVVTVWLNVNDLIEEHPVATYERELKRLIFPLTGSGATVLVATTPRIDSLPIYLACRPNPPPDGPSCPQPGVALPTPAEVRSMVAGYNDVIRRVAAEAGAIVVDLQLFGDAPAQHPEWIAEDGFHPSARGAEVIAEAFADALPEQIVSEASAPR